MVSEFDGNTNRIFFENNKVLFFHYFAGQRAVYGMYVVR